MVSIYILNKKLYRSAARKIYLIYAQRKSRQFVYLNHKRKESLFGFINWVDNVNWPPLRDSKADVSSVSSSSERIEELWVVNRFS